MEPLDSPILSGGAPGLHQIQGIGAGFIPGVLNINLVDEIAKVSYDNIKEMEKQLVKEKGIPAGISSG